MTFAEPSGHDLSIYAGSVAIEADYRLDVTAFMASPPGYETASGEATGVGPLRVSASIGESPVGPFMALLVGRRPPLEVAPEPPGGTDLGWDPVDVPLAIRMFRTGGGGTVSPVLPLGGDPDFGPPPLSVLARSLLDYLPPYEADDPRVQNLLAALANELARVEARSKDVIFRFFPQNADDRYGTLGLWEMLLAIHSEPGTTTLDDRRAVVLSTLRARNAGTGIRWNELLASALRTDVYTVFEGPSAYTVTIRVPVGSPTTPSAARRVARRITPAHLVIESGYEGGFLIGISAIGDAL